MTDGPNLTRRGLVAASALAPFLATTSACAQAPQGTAGTSPILVAYFTRSGNTRVIARGIARALGAGLFEVEPARPYPDDYDETVAQAERERQAEYRPALAASVSGLASYQTIFLGFPIWGMTAPSIIRSFLSEHDLSGKTLVPFITHGGYGTGSSLDVLSRHAPQARLIDPFVLECDQERRTLNSVNDWLDGLELPSRSQPTKGQ
ncbi:MAG: flavodoxin [Sphingomonas sp.]|uniref:flavodoxin n=1 Tax=Sphingomonas sp. TaxID=28214 RepID=UPI002620FACF|nr:flavodoxin [Sphingomonas sp.]MDK2770350.1 flavodoxin [Sphingomonas sp.]